VSLTPVNPVHSIETLCIKAGEFRLAIDSTPSHLRAQFFDLFPRGCCGDTCLLLGAWLEANSLGEWHTAFARRGSGATYYSHAWLEKDGLIVDITADQFGIDVAPVIVARRGDSTLHLTFEVQHKRVQKLYREEGPAIPGLRAFYERLSSQLGHSR
jgi:hypothetical protein